MTMTFSLHESIEPNAAFDRIDPRSLSGQNGPSQGRDEMPILREKLQIPEMGNVIDRPRINALLARSRAQFPATLICGRAGTGKTAIAASFARGQDNVAWYTADASDADWPVFSRYLSAALSNAAGRDRSERNGGEVSQTDIARFLVQHFTRPEATADGSSLLVLDDVHHVFDTPWFEDFFTLLLYSLPQTTHLLMLCRSKPPSPLWRLRSKQMLNVLDEKVIGFDLDETEALFSMRGLPSPVAETAHKSCYGRVSKLLQFAGA